MAARGRFDDVLTFRAAESVRLRGELGNLFVHFCQLVFKLFYPLSRCFVLRFERVDAVIQACDQCDRTVKRSGKASGHLHVVVNVTTKDCSK